MVYSNACGDQIVPTATAARLYGVDKLFTKPSERLVPGISGAYWEYPAFSDACNILIGDVDGIVIAMAMKRRSAASIWLIVDARLKVSKIGSPETR